MTDQMGLPDIGVFLSKEQNSRLAKVHRASWAETPHFDMGVLAGAGAIKASASNLLRFASQLLSGVEGDLGRAIELSLTKQTGDESLAIGLNWLVVKTSSGTWYLHNGQTYGSVSWFGFNPEHKRAAMIVSNTAAPAYCFGQRVFGQACTFPTVSRVSREQSQKMNGAYTDGQGSTYVVTEARGYPFARFVGGVEERLEQREGNTFTFTYGTVEFMDERDGRFTEVKITLSTGESITLTRQNGAGSRDIDSTLRPAFSGFWRFPLEQSR